MKNKIQLEKMFDKLFKALEDRNCYYFPEEKETIKQWILKALLPEIFKNILDHELISLEAGNEKHENWLKGVNWMRGQIKQNIKELGVEI